MLASPQSDLPGPTEFIMKTCPCNIHFRPVRTRWSGSTSRMRVIGEARNANLLSRTRLIAVSVVYWWVGNLYDVSIGLTELGGLSQSPCKME